MRRISHAIGISCLCALAASPPSLLSAQAAMPAVQAQESLGAARFAPGEAVPFSVKLLNFGSERRVDVTLAYSIVDGKGDLIEKESETVAVDTTASFQRSVPLPAHLSAGTYTLISSIAYDYQEVPATSQFQFAVEPKLFGFFLDDLLMRGAFFAALALLVAALSRFVMRRWFYRPYAEADYSSKPAKKRVYYEIIDTMIRQMRLRVGDVALLAAAGVPGLVIDPKSGEVLDLRAPPAGILESLVLRYETALGQHVRDRERMVEIMKAARPA